MRKDSYQQGGQNQQESPRRPKAERNCKSRQPCLVPFRSQADQRQLQESVKEPEGSNSCWNTEVKCAGDGMAEFPMRRQTHNVVKVRRHRARYQCGKNKSLAHGQYGGGMGWSEGQRSYSLA